MVQITKSPNRNLILTCRQHHRLVHEGGYRVELANDGRATFYDPTGRPVPHVPPLKRRTTAEVAVMADARAQAGWAPAQPIALLHDPIPGPGLKPVAPTLGDIYFRVMAGVQGV